MDLTRQTAIHNRPVSAVVVNWNGGPVVYQCVQSLTGQTLASDVHVIDNASTDGTAEWLEGMDVGVSLLRLNHNSGYAAGVNKGLQPLGGDGYVLLINNDVVLPDADSLQRVVEYLDQNPSVRGVCGRYEYPDGRFQHFYNRLPTPLALAVVFGFGKRFGFLRRLKTVNSFLAEDCDFSQPMTISQPAFACVMMRSADLKEVGGLDERYPIFFNDVDFCWRWAESGRTWHYLPWWRIVHHHGYSVNRLDVCQAELMSSAVRFANHRFSFFGRLLVRASVALESLYLRFVKGRRDVPVLDLIRGRTLFRPAAV